jgi:hypothetical protein
VPPWVLGSADTGRPSPPAPPRPTTAAKAPRSRGPRRRRQNSSRSARNCWKSCRAQREGGSGRGVGGWPAQGDGGGGVDMPAGLDEWARMGRRGRVLVMPALPSRSVVRCLWRPPLPAQSGAPPPQSAS